MSRTLFAIVIARLATPDAQGVTPDAQGAAPDAAWPGGTPRD